MVAGTRLTVTLYTHCLSSYGRIMLICRTQPRIVNIFVSVIICQQLIVHTGCVVHAGCVVHRGSVVHAGCVVHTGCVVRTGCLVHTG